MCGAINCLPLLQYVLPQTNVRRQTSMTNCEFVITVAWNH